MDSKIKDTIDWDKFADAHELDEYLGEEKELTEDEILALQYKSLMNELEALSLRMQKQLDRCRYYGEHVDTEEFDFLHREILRIRRSFG